jgi:hypothetical protein
MELIRFSEASVHIRTTQRYIPEDGTFITSGVRTSNPTGKEVFIEFSLRFYQNTVLLFMPRSIQYDRLMSYVYFFLRYATIRKVAVSDPDKVIEFLTIYFILSAALWPLG